MGQYRGNIENVHHLEDEYYAITGPLYPNQNLLFELSFYSNFAFYPTLNYIEWGRQLNEFRDTSFEVREWPYVDSIALKF